MNVTIAGNPWRRLIGLSGRRALPEGEALWLSPCRGIHTWGMRFPLDVLFLDGEGRVVRKVERMPPGRVSGFVSAARSVLELGAGGSKGTEAGDTIQFYD